MVSLTRGREAWLRDIWECLETVTDPELDESVAAMGFAESVSVDAAGDVQICLHLPTYWCAANFAFLMASDVREAVEALPWAGTVTVELQEHYCADEINSGVNGGLSFQETFADDAGGGLDGLRRRFRQKAFQRRQELLLRCLFTQGHTAARLACLSLRELTDLPLDDGEASRLRKSYVEIMPEVSGAADANGAAFLTVEGLPLDSETFTEYLRTLRRVRVNTEFNAHLCRGLLQARYAAQAPSERALRATAPARSDVPAPAQAPSPDPQSPTATAR
jgi:metal-sulfur cluster biosynthetic enzyme